MKSPCDDCRWNEGGRNSGCAKGYDMDIPNCPPEEREPYEEPYPIRFGMSQREADEYGDWRGHMDRDGN